MKRVKELAEETAFGIGFIMILPGAGLVANHFPGNQEIPLVVISVGALLMAYVLRNR